MAASRQHQGVRAQAAASRPARRRAAAGGDGDGDGAWSWTAACVTSGVVAAAAGALAASARGSAADAAAVAALTVTPVAALAARATPGGDIGLAAVRAAVEPVDGQAVLTEAGAGAPAVAASVTYTTLSHAVVAGKLTEKRAYLDTDTVSVPWRLRDAAGGVACLDASLTPALPLRALPATFTRVQDGGHLDIQLTRRSVRVSDSRDRERVFGIERVASVLTAGSLLTVVGRATLDGDGVVRLAAGSGPFAVTTDTLAAVVDSFRSAAAWKNGFAVALGVVAAGILVATAVAKARAPPSAAADDAGDPAVTAAAT